MDQLEQKEIDRLTSLGLDHEQEQLDEYIELLKSQDLWDIDFVEYKCYKVFTSEYKNDIKEYQIAYFQDKGKNIPLIEAGWILYFLATNQEHRMINKPAET